MLQVPLSWWPPHCLLPVSRILTCLSSSTHWVLPSWGPCLEHSPLNSLSLKNQMSKLLLQTQERTGNAASMRSVLRVELLPVPQPLATCEVHAVSPLLCDGERGAGVGAPPHSVSWNGQLLAGTLASL